MEAAGLDEFLSLGLVAVAYGVALLCLASGFLAVFAAGLALQRVKERPQRRTQAVGLSAGSPPSAGEASHTHARNASAAMTLAVRGFNEQLEKLAELAIVLLVGVMLSYAVISKDLS